MTFEMRHLFFENKKPITFTEETTPSWLMSKEFKWWFDDHVMKLDIGESIKSDFQKITRIL